MTVQPKHALLRSLQAVRRWLARRARKALDRMCAALPSQTEKQAVGKRLAHYTSRLSEQTNWQISRQMFELRLAADQHILDYRKCLSQARLATALEPDAALTDDTADSLRVATGTAPDTAEAAVRALGTERKAWQATAAQIRAARHPFFATQVFFRLSDRSGLEVASLIVGALIAIGAVQMLFFYEAAAGQSVHQYWTWDDLVIQAINIVPVALLTVLAVEILFNLCRRIAELLGRVGFILRVLKHPLWFATVVFLLPLMGTASYWGYFRGSEVFATFAASGGRELATVMDGSVLRNVHLVGTTSRAAVFLQIEDSSPPTEVRDALREVEGPRRKYADVAKTVVCGFPKASQWLPGFCAMSSTGSAPHAEPGREGTAGSKDLAALYRVFAMDRALVVCHSSDDACLSFPRRSELDSVRRDLQILSDRLARDIAQQQSRYVSSQRSLNRKFDALDEHLNRHLGRVLGAISPPPEAKTENEVTGSG